jgi:hypothetical protein
MKYAPLALLVLAACPSDESNPSTLWFAADGVETRLKLQDSEPRPW